jgi:hypothetical protein
MNIRSGIISYDFTYPQPSLLCSGQAVSGAIKVPDNQQLQPGGQILSGQGLKLKEMAFSIVPGMGFKM